MNVYTKNAKTLLFNQNGGIHAASPIIGTNTLLIVGENATTITGNNRGQCYRITANGAFVSVNDVTVAAPPPVDPPPPPPPPAVPADVDIVLTQGSSVTVKDTTGKVVFTYIVPS